jgi:hypothetical protein
MPPTANVSISRRLAYALFEPAAASPGLLMRRAFEEIGGNPHIGLAASDYGALMVLFASEQERAAAMSRFPLPFEGHTIRLERPEEGGNRFFWRFERLALVTATGFPVEHWDEGGIRNAFRSIGSVCCIDPLCLAEIDFSAVRLVLKLAEGGEVPNTLIMRDCHGQSSAEVHLRVVRCWPFEEDLSTRPFSHFDDLAGGGRRGDGARTTRMDDIDEDSVHGSPPAERGRGENSSVASLWRRIVERRQASIARAAALEDIDDVPPAFELGHFSPAAQSTPVAIWDRILARRLADQFPESGLDADQVNPVPPLSVDHLVKTCETLPNPPMLLIQWYDTLAIPATPLDNAVVDDGHGVTPLSATRAPAAPCHAEADFPDGGDDHEDAARKQRVRSKRAADSAFKARRSSRLAAKEPPMFTNMLSKAKAVKASRFDLTGGSPRLRATAKAAGFVGDGVPDAIPAPRLRALAAACGVDPDALDSAAPVSSGSG